MTTDLTNLRENYDRDALDESVLSSDPMTLFAQWLDTALEEKLPEPYAMTLATCGNDMKPSARTVLLRSYDNQGFVFYTNYDSHKGQQLADNPQAELLFFWHKLERQVRISGRVEKISKEESTAYFHKRPYPSQIGAWVSSPQSAIISERSVMQERYDTLSQKHPQNTPVPKPEFWGGYVLIPEQFEFWQGRPSRMHDRVCFNQSGQHDHNIDWIMSRLLP